MMHRCKVLSKQVLRVCLNDSYDDTQQITQ